MRIWNDAEGRELVGYVNVVLSALGDDQESAIRAIRGMYELIEKGYNTALEHECSVSWGHVTRARQRGKLQGQIAALAQELTELGG